jgi:glycoprotein endo-alpha-1,2-mannosidase
MITRRTALAGGLALAAPTVLPIAPAVAARPRIGKQVLTFYYPWYANPTTSGRWAHWQGPDGEAPRQSPTVNHPTLGMYDSHDPALVAAHARELSRAGVTGVIVSWWGKGSFEDAALPRILDALHAVGIATTVYLESQKAGEAGAASDIAHVLDSYAGHPGWLKVGNRPVLFLYLQALRDLPAREWRQAANRPGRPAPFLVGDISPRETAQFAAWTPFVDGIHVYVLAPYIKGMTPAQMTAWADRTYPVWQRMSGNKLFCATVIPGFDDTHVPGRPRPRPTVERFGGKTYAALWDAAIRHDADWVLVTSFNEWHEGSEIEPSRELGTRYLDLTAASARRFLGRA